MTDSPLPTSTGADQLRRVEELRRRRAGAAAASSRHRAARAPEGAHTASDQTVPRRSAGGTRRSRHPASGSRIAVAGGGLAAMLGMIAAFGLAERSAVADPVVPARTAPSQVVVVIHRSGEALPAGPAGSPSVIASASGPIALAARPIVTGAPPVAQTPAATTNGSR